MNSTANFVSFHQRRVVPVLPVGLICSTNIFVSPLSEFEPHMYSSDPRPARHCLVNAVGEPYSCPTGFTAPIQSLNQDIYILIPQLDGREVKATADFGITHIFFIFLFFDSRPGSCQPICSIIIVNKTLSSANAVPICSFWASGKNRRHVGSRNIMRSRVCAVPNKGITLNGI